MFLFATILEKLSETKCLDNCHRNFLSQTFGKESIDDILEFLSDDSQDIMTFYDWLFFPDVDFQKQIESILSGRNLSTIEQEMLIDSLVNQKIQSRIQLNSKTYQIISIGPIIIQTFVSRLRLTRFIPERLMNISYLDANQKNSVLVYLRNESIEWTDLRCDFICQIIQSFLNDQSDLFEILPQMLIFCGQYQNDFFQELVGRKNQLSQNLDRFKNLQSLQERHSMEFLLASGIRSIHVDILQSKAEIAIIDKVLFATNYSRF
jgi:hypothetical protein